MRPDKGCGSVDTAAHWRAELRLRFEARERRTVLAERAHRGPLLVQRPFYPEGPPAHVYVLHPPGGVVGGDELLIEAQCAAAAEALLTTPAAGKVYRSAGPTAHQSITLQLEDGAALEWLPQETILFDGARLNSRIRIDLAEHARFIGWDILCLGRPAAAEGFASGEGCFRTEIRKLGQPFLLETFLADGRFVGAGWGLRGHAAMASLFAHPFPKDMLPPLHARLEGLRHWGATWIEDMLICRGLGAQVEPLKRVLLGLWQLIRPGVRGKAACPPRIWAT